MDATTSVADLVRDIRIIDADTHLSEPHDLWTSRAPASLKDKVPRVAMHEGRAAWVLGDGIVLTPLGAAPGSVIARDGVKCRTLDWMQWSFEDSHLGAHDPAERLKVMDQSNIFAQIVYPNVLGFGGQNGWAADENLRFASVEIFNDAMAELQQGSGGRLYPMALLPWWDVKRSVAEAHRAKTMGLRGVIIHSDPHDHGLPDLADRSWDPLWEACAGLELPVNFHIGASDTAMAWFGNSFWPSELDDIRLAVGSSMIFFGNARVMANILMCGLLERHPTIKFVSVESGVGWISVLLESLEYQKNENASLSRMSLTPRELFERNILSCFWFERRFIADTIRQLGADNVMFETDYPHPTCLYPDPLEQAAGALEQLDPQSRRKVLSGNAARLYNIAT